MADKQEKVQVKFRFQTGDAGRLEIDAVDGKTYALRVGTVVFNVYQLPGQVTEDGRPAFEIGSGLLIANEEKKPEAAS